MSGLYDTTGMESRGSAFVKGKAEELADILRSEGFDVVVEHSGSAAGPSSYLRVHDPTTGRFFRDPIRISGHSKGAYNSQFVFNVTEAQFQDVLSAAVAMRAQGPSEALQALQSREATAHQVRIKSALKKQAAGKPLTKA